MGVALNKLTAQHVQQAAAIISPPFLALSSDCSSECHCHWVSVTHSVTEGLSAVTVLVLNSVIPVELILLSSNFL